MGIFNMLFNQTGIGGATAYTDKYGAVNTKKWEDDINAMNDYQYSYSSGEEDNSNFSPEHSFNRNPPRRKGWYRENNAVKRRARDSFNDWKNNSEEQANQRKINSQIMASSSVNDNANNVNEATISTKSDFNPAINVGVSTGKPRKRGKSISSSLGI